MFDLIIKKGMVIDPYQQIEGTRDIAVDKGKVVSIEETISTPAKKEIDGTEKVVTPGLIDLHTHVYWGGTPLGVEPDLHCLSRGVTTVLDAGSAGWRNFLGFRRFIIEQCKTRIIPLLHISSIGLIKRNIKPLELEDIRNVEYDKAVETAQIHHDLIKGFKIRFASPPNNYVGNNGPQAMRLVKEAAEDVGGIIMVHPLSMSPDCQLVDILKVLRKGDIVTHCFAPTYPVYFPHAEILDDTGNVHAYVKEAATRGIIFDVGHGNGGFSFDTANKAIKDGFLPTTISTDLYNGSVQTVIDLPTTMSKFLALGCSLSQVVAMCTTNPAKILGFAGRLGTLMPGAEADVTILDVKKGKFPFSDVRGEHLYGTELLTPVTTIKGGEII